MAISERINPDQLNIHQFQEVPKLPSFERVFDPEKDINFEDKQHIRDAVRQTIESRGPFRTAVRKAMDFADMAQSYKILWPNESLDNMPDDELMESREILKTGSADLQTSIGYPYNLKIIRPNLDLEISDEEWDKWVKPVLGSLGVNDSEACILFAKLKTMRPDFNFNLSELNRKNLEDMKREVRARVEVGFDSWSDANIIHAVPVMASLRLIDPASDFKLHESDYVRFLNVLENFKSTDKWMEYCKYAANLKILSANKVEITAPGVIEFQMYSPEDVNTSTPPMPEIRKF